MKDKVILYDDDGNEIETTYDQLVRLFVATIENYYGKEHKCKCGGGCEKNNI